MQKEPSVGPAVPPRHEPVMTRLRVLRVALGIRQHVLARTLDIPQPALSHAERGWATDATLVKLGIGFGTASPALLLQPASPSELIAVQQLRSTVRETRRSALCTVFGLQALPFLKEPAA